MELNTFAPASPTPSIHEATLPYDPHPPPYTRRPKDASRSPTRRPASHHVIPSHITIHHLTPTTLPSFRRLISLLLPIPYPDKFFNLTLSDPVISSLSRVALWQVTPPPARRKSIFSSSQALPQPSPSETSQPLDSIVVGGIRCILEPIDSNPSSTLIVSSPPQHQIYIQTLAVLSPYRSNGIAISLLNTILHSSIQSYNVVSVYAHVWEANTEALEWYQKRGFVLGELVEGYYRRLKPDGARIVRKSIGVIDLLSGMIETREG